jgi:lipopolysaccharide/colanic/teichoic acid biosynthesis glycosyltransferase
MEPDILATPGDKMSTRTAWPVPEDGPVDTPASQGHPAPGVIPAITPAPRPETNGNGANGHHAGPNGQAAVHSRELSRARLPDGYAGATLSAASAATMVEFDLRATSSFYLRTGKRVLDVAGAALALVLAAPLLLLAAIAIKLESRGPVLYRSTRVGRGGRSFTFLKLRSMVHGADQHRHRLSHLNECDGPVFKMNRDPRVTRVGRLLRVTSIDEIPQFVNVLMGHMSLVGPRPPIPEEVAQYEPWQLRRLDVRPGLTCLWQISGRSRIGFQEWMRLDLEYIRRQSFALDMNILLRTVPAVLSREGAY